MLGQNVQIRLIETSGPAWMPQAARELLTKLFCPSPIGLVLEGANDEDLARLKDLSWLRYVYLSGPGVTDNGLKYLIALKNLKVLVFENTEVSESGQKALMQAFSRLTFYERREFGIFHFSDDWWTDKYPHLFLTE